jgi:class 3 adenylate cyclase/uncharacterized membrane protein
VWRAVTHCGVTPQLTRDDVKYVVATNAFAVCAVVLMLAYAHINHTIGHPATNILSVVELTAAPLFGMSLWMNRRQRHLAASTWLIVCGLAVVTSAVVITGRALGSELFYIVLAIAPFFTYPRHRLGIATLVSAAGLMAVIATLLIHSGDPLVGGPIVRARPVRSLVWSYAGVHATLIIIAYQARRMTQTVEDELIRERHLSETLLRNILPDSVATRLKQNSGAVADHYPEATVLFADIVGFSSFATNTPPQELVAFLNSVFSRFDGIVEELGVEKIKTIGDAYMVAGGIPGAVQDGAERVMQLAIGMHQTAKAIRTPAGTPLQLRIGMSTGPVIAGVIGFKKYNYDLWGDTVNMASRMEAQGLPGAIQVTERTHELLKGRHSFVQRGPLDVKGRGPTLTWIHTPQLSQA